jgi:hypothetical protein
VETFVQTFSDLIRDRLAELRLNAFSAENAAGLPPDAIRNVLRSEKQSGPTLARTKEICDALGLEIRIGPKHLMAALNAADFRNVDALQDDVPSGFLTIPWAEKALGAGSAPVCFSHTWLLAHDLKIDFLKAVLPDEVSVDGVPSEGALAVVDSRAGLRKGHGLWSYRRTGRVHVSHITFAGDVTVLHPARAEAEPTILEGDISGLLEIYGKVVWLGQSIPLKGRVG